MRISRVLNNNVAFIDVDGKKQIVCGKGIAFHKKVGDQIDESMINEVFVMKDESANQRLLQLLNDLPAEYVEYATEIIEKAQMRLNTKLDEGVLVALSDHLWTTIRRFKDGFSIPNALSWEISRYYEKEYAIGMEALALLEQRTGYRLPDDEAGFIAIHIVNAELENSSIQKIYEMTKALPAVLSIVKYNLKLEFAEDSVYYHSFVTHLKFLLQRLFVKKNHEIAECDQTLLEIVREKYRKAYKCTEVVSDFLAKQYGFLISDEEKLYLAIHLQRIIEKKE